MDLQSLAGKKIIILHDYFLYKGGGERLVISMAKGLNCEIATAFVGKDAFDPRDEGIPTKVFYNETKFSNIPGFRYLQVNFNFFFRTGFLKNYDVVIYSGDCLIAMLRTGSKQTNIAYMHTPPRHLYDMYQDRLDSYNFIKKLFFIPFAVVNRWRFSSLSKKFASIVANSINVQQRVKTYLKMDSKIVYPPVDINKFKWLGEGDYFLSWGRLYPAKRVDLVVEAFKLMPDQKLIVASGGPELDKLKAIAGDAKNIEFLGWISDEKLLDLVGNCQASVYIPIREDFGMSPVESMSAGKPVIGVAEGGMLETVVPEKTGLLIKPDFTTQDIIDAVRKLDKSRAAAMRNDCEQEAKKFAETEFISAMQQAIIDTLN